jgi:hypothetical protein
MSLADQIVGPLTRALVFAVIVLPLCLIGIRFLHPYQSLRAAHTVEHWAVHLSPDHPEDTGTLRVVYLPRTLTISKLTGGVVMDAYLTGPAPESDQVWAMQEWDLRDHPFSRQFSIADLAPGDYTLTFRYLQSVPGYDDARLGYVYTQGGGPVAQRLGLAEGLMVSTAFVAGSIIVAAGLVHLFIILRRSRANTG